MKIEEGNANKTNRIDKWFSSIIFKFDRTARLEI